MEPAPATITPEAHKLPDDLSFANIVAIEDLRQQQRGLVNDAISEAIKPYIESDDPFDMEKLQESLDARKAAETRTAESFDDQCKTYLDAHLTRADNPDAYDKLLFMLRTTSVDKMDVMKWQLGDQDADGEYRHPETSGQAMVKAMLDQLRADYPAAAPDAPEAPLLPETPEYAEAAKQLAESRNKLAALSLKRRQMLRKRGKKANQLENDYAAASADYNARVRTIQAGLIGYWRGSGKTEPDILSSGVTVLLDEHQQFSQAEMRVMERDDTRRYKIARWIATHKVLGISSNIGASMAVGYGLKTAVKGVAGVTLGFAAPMAVAGLVAGRSAKAMLSATIGNKVDHIRHFDDRYKKDHAQLEQQARRLSHDAGATDLDKAGKTTALLKEIIDQRVAADVKSNRRRVRNAVILSGAAAVAGEFIQEMVSTGGHPLGIGTHHETPTNPPGNPGPSGGGQPPANGGNLPPGSTPPGQGGAPLPPDINPPAGPGPDHGGLYPHHEPSQTPSAPKPHAEVINSKDITVTVENGNGYYQEIQDIFNQNGQHLSGAGVRELYSELAGKFHGSFFTNDASYKMSGGFYGIGHPGSAHWNPAVIHYMNEWAEKHPDMLSTIGKTAKAAGKAGKAALAGAGK